MEHEILAACVKFARAKGDKVWEMEALLTIETLSLGKPVRIYNGTFIWHFELPSV